MYVYSIDDYFHANYDYIMLLALFNHDELRIAGYSQL
jgi:hypothetical protein